MIRNYLKVAWRNLVRNPIFLLVNTLGLGVAICVCILLVLTAFQEFSYDRFHAKRDRLFRIFLEQEHPERGTVAHVVTPTPLAPAVEETIDGAVGMRWGSEGAAIVYGGQTHDISMRLTDPTFFEHFSFDAERGDLTSALDRPDGLILDAPTARRIFGAADPIGATVELFLEGQPHALTVRAIAEKAPRTSSFQFDAIASITLSEDYDRNKTSWDNVWHTTYVALPDGMDKIQAESALQTINDLYYASNIEQLLNDGARPGADGQVHRLKLQPITDLHFGSYLPGTRRAGGRLFPIALLVIAGFILAIACINFVNLTIGTSIRRATEIGIRKVTGATRAQLIGQFWAEALLVIGIAIVVGLALATTVLPYYNDFLRTPISIWQPKLMGALLLITALVALLGGGYPATALSRFQLSQVLKKNTRVQRPGGLQYGLTVLQFTIATALICCTIIVQQQLNYFRNKPLGFNEEEVVSIPVPKDVNGERMAREFRMRTRSNPDILSVSGCYMNIGMGRDGSQSLSRIGFLHEGRNLVTAYQRVDYGYFKTMDIELLEGRSFDPNRPADRVRRAVINESFAQQLGPDYGVGTQIQLDSLATEIIGVVPDFHFADLSEPIGPLTMTLDEEFPIDYVLVKVRAENTANTMAALEDLFAELAPTSEFQGSFLDENTERQYRGEQTMYRIFTAGALLTIFLSVLGLFAMAVLAVAQRRKEIGIRKVLGASTVGIVALLTQRYTLLVFAGAVLATPLAYLAMRRWLDTYAYRIDIQWWVFVLAALLSLAIAIFTIGIQSIRAALTNPIQSIRVRD